MTSLSPADAATARVRPGIRSWLVPSLVTAAAFLVVFAKPIELLFRDWWTDPEAGHGLLLAPAALWIAWRRRLLPDRAAGVAAGLALLIVAVVSRLAAELAAELYIMRLAVVLALAGLVVYYWGVRQVLAW